MKNFLHFIHRAVFAIKSKHLANTLAAFPVAAVMLASSQNAIAEGAFAPTGSLQDGRRDFLALCLTNGNVLALGGWKNAGPLSTTEIYNPSTGAWSVSGSMSIGRDKAAAVVLANGKVLVTGGNDRNASTTFFSTCELYDPSTGTWSPTGSMNTARTAHSATLLEDGRVLVCGGYDNGQYLSSAEIYDPQTGIWSSTGSMSVGRDFHGAARLPNGKVLVVGGRQSSYVSIASCEVYNPATGTWSVTGSLATRREWPATILLGNGKVLAVGGGQDNSTAMLASAELYNPTTGTWSSAGTLSRPRQGHTATLLENGRVLTIGGDGPVGPPAGRAVTAELYDPESNQWSVDATPIVARSYHAAALLPDGRVLVAGGNSYVNGPGIASSEIYLSDSDGDGLTDAWEQGFGRYQVVQGSFTWDQAKADAVAKGGHLATVTSLEEWTVVGDLVKNLSDDNYWLGGSDIHLNGNWAWVNGETWGFTAWRQGEPNNSGGEPYVVMSPRSGVLAGWNDWRSYEVASYILEYGYPTDPLKADTDGDGYNDKVESDAGSDPNNASSTPVPPDSDGDGVNDYREGKDGTSPTNAASFNPLSKGLVAFYPFSGNANDESGRGKNGSVQGAQLSTDRLETSDAAYSFDGNDWIETDNLRLLDGASEATISAWITVGSGLASGQVLAIGDYRSGVDPVSMRLTPTGTSQVNFHNTLLGNTPSASIGGKDDPQALGNLADGWQHVVVVLSKDVPQSSFRIYVNGVEQLKQLGCNDGVSSFGTISYDRDMRMLIGALEARPFYGAPSQFWKGKIDEVRVYDRALNSSEIASLYIAEAGALAADSDGDGIPNICETGTGVYNSPTDTGTDPNKADTDGDGLNDGVETATAIYLSSSDTGTDPNAADSDGDGLSDGAETHTGTYVSDSNTGTSPVESDSNGDGISDGDAVLWKFNPNWDLTPVLNYLRYTAEQGNGGRQGLYTTNAISDLNLGKLLIQKSGGIVNLQLQLQTKADLKGSWTNYGSPMPLLFNLPGNKGFLRVQALGPQ